MHRHEAPSERRPVEEAERLLDAVSSRGPCSRMCTRHCNSSSYCVFRGELTRLSDEPMTVSICEDSGVGVQLEMLACECA